MIIVIPPSQPVVIVIFSLRLGIFQRHNLTLDPFHLIELIFRSWLDLLKCTFQQSFSLIKVTNTCQKLSIFNKDVRSISFDIALDEIIVAPSDWLVKGYDFVVFNGQFKVLELLLAYLTQCLIDISLNLSTDCLTILSFMKLSKGCSRLFIFVEGLCKVFVSLVESGLLVFDFNQKGLNFLFELNWTIYFDWTSFLLFWLTQLLFIELLF